MKTIQVVAVSSITTIAVLLGAHEFRNEGVAATNASPLHGAVLAFVGVKECSKAGGWSDYPVAAGRVLIGAGQGYDFGITGHKRDSGAPPDSKKRGRPLLPRTAGDVGGYETVMLGLENIPNHTHDGGGSAQVWAYNNGTGGFGLSGGPGQMVQDAINFQIGKIQGYPSTGQQAVTTMPPWLAVKYCVHD